MSLFRLSISEVRSGWHPARRRALASTPADHAFASREAFEYVTFLSAAVHSTTTSTVTGSADLNDANAPFSNHRTA